LAVSQSIGVNLNISDWFVDPHALSVHFRPGSFKGLPLFHSHTRSIDAMASIFGLLTAHDLREKLRRDLDRMKAAPADFDSAFNFFVTAESLLDWAYPGDASRDARKSVKDGSVHLQVCSHIANGAKHLELRDRQHKSVESVKAVRGGMFPESYFPRDYFPDDYFGARCLVVHLKDVAAAGLGESIASLELAERVMAFWDSQALARAPRRCGP
jgi:hypothetical protein